MMVKPTTAELLQKTGDNKFRLVIATAKRARQIASGSEKLTDVDEEEKAVNYNKFFDKASILV